MENIHIHTPYIEYIKTLKGGKTNRIEAPSLILQGQDGFRIGGMVMRTRHITTLSEI